MLRKTLFIVGIAIVTCGHVYAQNGTIKGRVVEDDGKTPIEFATVRLMQEGDMILGTVTDDKGNYSLTPVPSGKYNVLVSYVGYPDVTLEGVEIKGSQTKVLDDIKMSSKAGGKEIEGVVIRIQREVFDNEATKKEGMDNKELQDLASKDINSALAMMSGVTRSQDGSLSIRANRGGTTYYVDGIPTSSVPSSMIGSFSLISGSIPAEYGDANAVIEIETKGPSSKISGDIMARTYVDGHDYAAIDASLTGPIVKPRGKDGKKFSMGYALGLSAKYSKGPVLWKGYYRASQETIDYLKKNPFRASEGASDIVISNLEYVTKYQEGNILSLEEKRARQMRDAWTTSVNIRPKIDIRTPANMDFSIGGRFSYNLGKDYNTTEASRNMLFNSENNRMEESMGWEVNVRFTHRLGGSNNKEKSNKSIIKNAYYRLTGYYINSSSKTYSHIHKDNIFDYGYVGKFEHTKIPFYEEKGKVTDSNGVVWDIKRMISIQNISVDFTPSDLNPTLAQYTNLAYERFYEGNSFFVRNDEDIQRYNGLLNGRRPELVYGLYSAPGLPHSGIGKSVTETIGGKALVVFEIKDHAFRLGFNYDQTTYRSYSISAAPLWTLMRQLTNRHIMELDFGNPIFRYDEFGNATHVDYERLVDKSAQTEFDKKIREQMKKGAKDWIDVDVYDPSDFSLDWFSPEELFNGGGDNSYIAYYGFDYTGKNKNNRAITMANIKNWFNDNVNSGNAKRNLDEIGATKPVKMAAFIEDKFTIKTLYVQLGLRLDIFNSNQPYVKDMFLYRDAYTVKGAGSKLPNDAVPDFMKNSDEYYVYVKDPTAPTVEITAFRKGTTWYDKKGNEVSDPTTIINDLGETQLVPYLIDPPANTTVRKQVDYKAFATYTPTFANGGVTLSPRIAFSFSVGENSVFSASYNVVTNWSSNIQRFNPVTYLYFEKLAQTSGTSPLSNPGLKPERSVNYEIGFKQLINKQLGLAMEFSAYYSEKRDQVVAYQYSQAYPSTYISYMNMDFGTVQGFVLALNMRNNNRVSFRANYTLQFAKGTGSDPNSTLSMLRSGSPNLRTLTALDNDQRHNLSMVVTYGFGHGEGPVTQRQTKKGKVKETKWLQNAGITLEVVAGSGMPYTRSSVAYSQVLSGLGTRVVEGGINGSHMPWVLDGNLTIRKGFVVGLKKDAGGTISKSGRLMFALAIHNIIGYKNERFVYSYTGSRLDDGFLTSKDYQQYINERENVASFIDYYTIRMEGLNPYGSPRTFELQVSFAF